MLTTFNLLNVVAPVAPVTCRVFPSLFILASAVCKSLQCLISALTQGSRSGHFLRLTCSLVLWGGRTLQTNIADVCGECSQFMDHTGFAPARSVCAFLVYTAQAPGCSAGHSPRQALCFMNFPGLNRSGSDSQVLCKGTDSVRCAFCALPRSEQLRWPGLLRAHSISLHWLHRKSFLSLLGILCNSAFRWACLSFSPLPFALLYLGICKASSDNHYVFSCFFFLGMPFITTSSVHSSSGILSIRNDIGGEITPHILHCNTWSSKMWVGKVYTGLPRWCWW